MVSLFFDMIVVDSDYYHNDLTVYAVNKSDDALYYKVERPVCNGSITCSSFTGMSDHLDAGKKGFPESIMVYDDQPIIETFGFDNETKIGAVKDISSLSFKLTVNSDTTKETLWNEDTITVTFKDGAHYEPYSYVYDKPYIEMTYEPLFGVTVEPQTLADTETYRVDLLNCGSDGYSFYQVLRIKNKTDQQQSISYGAFAIDDILADQMAFTAEIDPFCEFYYYRMTGMNHLEKQQISAMQKLSFAFRTDHLVDNYICYGESEWFDAKLKNPSASASDFKRGDTVIMERDGVTWTLLRSEPDEYNENYKKWYVAIENNSDKDIRFELRNEKVFNADGKEIEEAFLSYDKPALAPGQRTVLTLSGSLSPEKVDSISFTVNAFNSQENRLYYQSDEVITLK